jgi:cytochrome b pre-mRNA-processing protein 3
MIVTQAREPVFYQELRVPDTVNGRFDLLLVHLWMILRRLRGVAGGTEIAQALFDHFCDDMDANLREMGVGDLAVPKRMQAFGEAFYGRSAAYDLALTDSNEALAQAFCKNLLAGKDLAGKDLAGKDIDNARRLAAYVQAALAGLDKVEDAALLAAAWTFPSPLSLTEQGHD